MSHPAHYIMSCPYHVQYITLLDNIMSYPIYYFLSNISCNQFCQLYQILQFIMFKYVSLCPIYRVLSNILYPINYVMSCPVQYIMFCPIYHISNTSSPVLYIMLYLIYHILSNVTLRFHDHSKSKEILKQTF